MMVWKAGMVNEDGRQARVLYCIMLCGHIIACTAAGLMGCT